MNRFAQLIGNVDDNEKELMRQTRQEFDRLLAVQSDGNDEIDLVKLRKIAKERDAFIQDKASKNYKEYHRYSCKNAGIPKISFCTREGRSAGDIDENEGMGGLMQVVGKHTQTEGNSYPEKRTQRELSLRPGGDRSDPTLVKIYRLAQEMEKRE